MKSLAILGSTGSVGKSTLDVIRKNKDEFKIELLTACLLYTSDAADDC